MNKKQFMKVIREVVRKEVQKEVKKIFIKEQSSPKMMDVVSDISNPKREVQYTKNKSLNDVLNETVGLTKSQKESTEYPTLSGGAFDTTRMSEMMGYGKSEDMKRDMIAVDTIKKAGKSLEQVPDHVTNALTKDYSKLMKAIEKKKGGPL